MISSMTAFTRATKNTEWGQLTWEIRAVNQRYLELSLRMPETLRDAYDKSRQVLQKRLSRGKVEATLKYQAGDVCPFKLKVNDELLTQLRDAGDQVNQKFPSVQTSLVEILNWPGVLKTEETNMQSVATASLELLEAAVNDFCEMRQREGKGIHEFLEARMAEIMTNVDMIESHLPEAIELQSKKIKDKFNELKLDIDHDRLEHEMLWFIQKADIAEEVQRLKSHCKEMNRVLKKGGVAGKRLDFLLQELNREANTTASKSVSSVITHAAVDMKVAIEQMREQVQNIE